MKVLSARSQYRALCYRQISTRLGHAVAKASVMRLLGLPRLPISQHAPRSLLARNCPGPADSFVFPSPLSNAASLGLSTSSPLALAPPGSSFSSSSGFPASTSP